MVAGRGLKVASPPLSIYLKLCAYTHNFFILGNAVVHGFVPNGHLTG